mgnify:CR=1 FL=1
MALYWIKTPKLLKRSFQQMVWEVPQAENAIPAVYLTFDDGPHPDITPWVMEQLARYDASGTFFCIGKNVDRYPDTYQALTANGHVVANHTYNHLNGWQTDDATYFDNVARCAEKVGSRLFRPPYGRISLSQAAHLKQHYQLIMWDVLSADFDTKVQPEACTQNVIKHLRPGSIIVFHDSVKAWPRLKVALPQVLAYIRSQQWQALPLNAYKL